MSAVPVRTDGQRYPRWAGFLALAAVLLLAIGGAFAPSIVLHGWLIAFASVGGVALGCIAWTCIHALTGGRWGELGGPALRAGSGTLPLVLILALPLILADRWLYPWAADPRSVPSEVGHLYLNTWSVALRSVVLLGGLGLVAWRNRKGVLAPFPAALALLLYGGLINLSAFDWLLSLDPRYTSSAIGMQMIVAQLLSAMCCLVLVAEAPKADPVWGDYGALIFACLLGEGYLLLMTFVVHWYGDLPEQAAWYLARTEGPWRWLEIVGTALGAVGPGVALLFARIRRSRRHLRVVAGVLLGGILVENIWLVAPHAGLQSGWAVLAALLAILACGGLAAAVASRWLFVSGIEGSRKVER